MKLFTFIKKDISLNQINISATRGGLVYYRHLRILRQLLILLLSKITLKGWLSDCRKPQQQKDVRWKLDKSSGRNAQRPSLKSLKGNVRDSSWKQGR